MIDHFSLALLTLLSDGQSHAINTLAKGVGLEVTATLERLQALQAAGVKLALNDDGWHLLQPLECLEREQIRALLEPCQASLLSEICLLHSIDSTNAYLLQKLETGQRQPIACLAECQQAGRGRRGRTWSSPFAANLYLSLSWLFDPAPAHLSALSLASGVAVVRALERLGLTDISLKWPNDILWQHRKLGGILLESRFFGRRAGVVIGIGLNVAMPEQEATGIDQPWVDLREVNGGDTPSRNQLAAAVLDELLQMLVVFEADGFISLRDDWQRFDGFYGQPVVLHLPSGEQRHGVAQGVDEQGALRLATEWGEERFAVGEVSLRRG